MDLSHPLGITLCQIIIDRYYMDTASGKCVKIRRKRRYECFTFTCLHLGYTALMKDDAADDLHPVVFHIKDTPCSLPYDRKGFRKYVIERGSVI